MSNQRPRGLRSQGTQAKVQHQRRKGRVSAARLAAYDVLRDVDERDAYANLALPKRIRDARLDHRDASFVTELVSGTLRGQGRYDAIIQIAAQRPVTEIDQRTIRVLRLGAHQILSMRTASHAAVNESVELQRIVSQPQAAGFVNGVLREIERTSHEEWDERLRQHAASEDDLLAVTYSHPKWIIRAYRNALQSEDRAAELTALLQQNNVAPKIQLVYLGNEDAKVLHTGTTPEHFNVTVAGPSPIGYELEQGDPGKYIASLPIGKGLVRVQDQGSQLAALALVHAKPIQPDEKWLDLCAGPGGKTAILAAEASRNNAHLRANEISQHRTALVADAIIAHAESVDLVNFDGREDDAFGGELFHRILLDAPCSGLGALRRRPEARWRKQPGDLPQLTNVQAELLEAAAQHLARDGVIAYVTCSPHLAETRVMIDSFLKKHPEISELNARDAVQRVARTPLDLPTAHLSAQLWPHRHGTDAMFISLLTRR